MWADISRTQPVLHRLSINRKYPESAGCKSLIKFDHFSIPGFGDFQMNQLWFGDNLTILREEVASESVDLIYLDPPFNSNANYNVLFRTPSDEAASAQVEAFRDTWTWGNEAQWALDEIMMSGGAVANIVHALHSALGESDMMAYLVMMAQRLTELHRVLRSSGSIFLHCDPTASHYLKIILDSVFGPTRYTNEIVWKRSDAHNDAKQGAKHFGRVHDVLLFFRKGRESTFNVQYSPLPQSTVDKWYRHIEEETGRRYNKADVTGPGVPPRATLTMSGTASAATGATAEIRWSDSTMRDD